MKRCLFFIILFLSSFTEGFARAGGGSGGGGIGYGMGVICIILFFILLSYRTRQSKKQIKISREKDPAWDYEKMTVFVQEAFMCMQKAWMKKDLSMVDDIITGNLKANLEKKIKHLKFINETNYLEEIAIEGVKIIGCEDHLDDEQDSFTAYVYGSMIDYSVSGLTGNITTNSGKHKKKFRDLYYFKRHVNHWQLDRIENSVEINALFKAKHIIE